MIFALDVHYGPADICTRVACVGFLEWTSSAVTVERTLDLGPPAAYVPGKFYERELAPLLAVLANMPQPDALVIDGYVWLGDDETPGLGAHLHNALGARIPVVGVAKNSFRGATKKLCGCSAEAVTSRCSSLRRA